MPAAFSVKSGQWVKALHAAALFGPQTPSEVKTNRCPSSARACACRPSVRIEGGVVWGDHRVFRERVVAYQLLTERVVGICIHYGSFSKTKMKVL